MQSPSHHLGCAIFATVLLLFGVCGQAAAQEAYSVQYGPAQGLNVGEIAALAQDADGFIWIGANGGLIRFDGVEFKRWAPGVIRHLVTAIEAGSRAGLAIRTWEGRVYDIHGAQATVTLGPDGSPLAEVKSLLFDATDRLWIIRRGGVWIRSGGGTWTRLPPAAFGRQTPIRLRRLTDAVAVLTDQAVWRVTAAGSSLMYGGGARAVTETSDDTAWILDAQYRLFKLRHNRVSGVDHPNGRVMSMTARGETLWMAIDRYLVGFGDEGVQTRMGSRQGIASGGPLLVDHEGGLWLGTFVGLQYFPQPETLQWTEADGLISNHAYHIDLSGGRAWISTWQGVDSVEQQPPFKSIRSHPGVANPVCGDPDFGLLFGRGGSLFIIQSGATRRLPTPRLPPDAGIRACLRDAGGRIWLATSAGLLQWTYDIRRRRWTVRTQTDVDDVNDLWPDRSGGVWLLKDSSLCHALSDLIERRGQTCFSAPGNVEFRSGVGTGPADALLATDDGLYRFNGATFTQMRLESGPLSSTLTSISASPRGGVWIAGPGVLQRVRLRPGSGNSVDLVESPSTPQGLPGNAAIFVRETADGVLWIAGNRGVFRLPPSARAEPVLRGPVKIVKADIDGTEQADLGRLVMTPGSHRMTLSLSALSYQDPLRTLFRYRTRGDRNWSTPFSTSNLQFIDPADGRHRIQIIASADGRRWTPETDITFSVQPPWWRSPLAYCAYVLLTVLILFVVARLRLEHLLSLERQRHRIAMDLHDEIGSNLGSIGLLANEASRHTDDPEKLPQVLGQIANLAQLTNIGLRLMGRTLKDDQSSIADLSREIRAQIAKLAFEDQVSVRFAFHGLDVDMSISSAVQRHAVMILVEATHNALKHSAANRLTVSLAGDGPDACLMTIADDGSGFDPKTSRGRGSGLENMRRRAAEAGGTVQIQSTPGIGTEVTFRFPCSPPTNGAGPDFVRRWLPRSLSRSRALTATTKPETKQY